MGPEGSAAAWWTHGAANAVAMPLARLYLSSVRVLNPTLPRHWDSPIRRIRWGVRSVVRANNSMPVQQSRLVTCGGGANKCTHILSVLQKRQQSKALQHTPPTPS
jgi:hypothetical protein